MCVWSVYFHIILQYLEHLPNFEAPPTPHHTHHPSLHFYNGDLCGGAMAGNPVVLLSPVVCSWPAPKVIPLAERRGGGRMADGRMVGGRMVGGRGAGGEREDDTMKTEWQPKHVFQDVQGRVHHGRLHSTLR